MTAPAPGRLDRSVIGRRGVTRFAPAPTGHLHLGHVANAVHVWGIGARAGARVLLRIEDHDRERSRPEYDAALLEDLAWLGFVPDTGPVRQSERHERYRTAREFLQASGLIYACDCSRATFAAWRAKTGAAWTGAGCPGSCRDRHVPEGDDVALRIALGDGSEAWTDGLIGRCEGPVAPNGDLAVRDRLGNWTYGFAVVVDDLEQGVDLVIRGHDLLDSTPAQVRLARLLGRSTAPAFVHHPLVLKAPGVKLSKADRDTSIGELRAAGTAADALIGRAAAAVGLLAAPVPIPAARVADLFPG